jgi:hypothetical protein
MQIRDQALWAQAKAELSGDGAVGEAFLAFVIDWVDRAEKVIMERNREFLCQDGTWVGQTSPAQALRDSLPAADRAAAGDSGVSLSYVAQGLVIILANWTEAEGLWKGLTTIESKVVSDMIAIKYFELQASAEAVDGRAL